MNWELNVKEKTDKIGYPPSGIVRKALENLFVSIVGAIDVLDFETFLKESADLAYEEAKEKLVATYGSPRHLSEAGLRAKTAEAKARLEQAEREARAGQRTLEEEFVEVEQIADRYLGENFGLVRRNDELEREIKRLREELAGRAAPPVPAAPPAAHGSMYQEYRKRISEVTTMADINDLASEIFDIAEREEYDKLTKGDIAELLEELRKVGERRAMKLAEMKIPEIKPRIRKVPPPEREERREKRERRPRREAPSPAPPPAGGPPQILHVYTRPDLETFVSMGETYVRDFELERTLMENKLLGFPEHFYTLSGWGKREYYGWDIASALGERVKKRRLSWEGLHHDYGIPEEYIKGWRARCEEIDKIVEEELKKKKAELKEPEVERIGPMKLRAQILAATTRRELSLVLKSIGEVVNEMWKRRLLDLYQNRFSFLPP